MHGRWFSGLIILTSSILMGCGGGGGAGSRSATKPVAAGELAVSPATLDFGKVTVGTSKAQTGTLTAGDSSITVTSADWTGDGYSISGIVFPLTVAAGQNVPFNISFAPHRAGNATGKITFQSDASNVPKAAFSGRGTQTAAHSVTLSWRTTAASVLGYNIYRGAATKGPFSKINSSPHPNPTFTDASVVGGMTYFYMTTAVSKKGRESKYSNRVQVTVPNS
jgi:hypothetical protein